ncbi:MAG: DUF2911 domain-containing protein [Opitutaceae bacterium]
MGGIIRGRQQLQRFGRKTGAQIIMDQVEARRRVAGQRIAAQMLRPPIQRIPSKCPLDQIVRLRSTAELAENHRLQIASAEIVAVQAKRAVQVPPGQLASRGRPVRNDPRGGASGGEPTGFPPTHLAAESRQTLASSAASLTLTPFHPMNKLCLRSTLASLLCVAGLAVSTSLAQPAATPPAPPPATTASAVGTMPWNNQPRVSPHATTSQYIGADRALVMITYGRPYTIKPGTTLVRKIWGGQVPWDKADRLGADESTVIITPMSLVIGDTTVPAGAYTLYIIPSENGTSKLAFSKAIGKWGIGQNGRPDETQDVARFDLVKETLPMPVDQLTITVEKVAATNSGVIKIAWENTQFSLPFAVKK